MYGVDQEEHAEGSGGAAVEARALPEGDESTGVMVFRADYDDEGVYFYQAFNDGIGEWAVANQRLVGAPGFDPRRMTWIKPSFAWMLYRSGYGRKHNQTTVLRVKLPHAAVAAILEECRCVEAEHRGGSDGAGGGGRPGRVQWDPERDVLQPVPSGREPGKMTRRRAIQIGLAGRGGLSERYSNAILAVEDVSELARAVGEAHAALARRGRRRLDAAEEPLAALLARLPRERPYLPDCPHDVLQRLGMVPGAPATALVGVGRGCAADAAAALDAARAEH